MSFVPPSHSFAWEFSFVQHRVLIFFFFFFLLHMGGVFFFFFFFFFFFAVRSIGSLHPTTAMGPFLSFVSPLGCWSILQLFL